MCGACPRPGPWSSRGHPTAAPTCASHRSDACVAETTVAGTIAPDGGGMGRTAFSVSWLDRTDQSPRTACNSNALLRRTYSFCTQLGVIAWLGPPTQKIFGHMLDDQTNPIRTSFPIVTHDGRRNFTMRPSLLWHNCTLGKAGCTPTTVTATTAPQSQPPNIYNSNQISNGSRQVRTSRYSS